MIKRERGISTNVAFDSTKVATRDNTRYTYSPLPSPLIPDNSNRGKKSGSPSSAGSRAILNGTRHAARAYIYTCTCTSHLNMRTRKWPYAARRPGLRLLMNCIIRDIHSAGFTLTRLLLHFIKSPLRGATGTDDEPRVRRSPKYQVPFNPD